MAEEDVIRNERGRHLVGFAKQQRKAIVNYLGDRPVTFGVIYRGGRPYLPSMDSVLYLEGVDDVKYSSVEERNGRIEFGWSGHEDMMIRDRVLLVLNTINDSVSVPKKTALEAERLIRDSGMLDFGYVIGDPFNIMTLRDLYREVGLGESFLNTVASLKDEEAIQEYIRRHLHDIISFFGEDEACFAIATRGLETASRKIAGAARDHHDKYIEGPVLIQDSGKRPAFYKASVEGRKVLVMDPAVWMAPEFPEEILKAARGYKGTFDMKGLVYLTPRGPVVIEDELENKGEPENKGDPEAAEDPAKSGPAPENTAKTPPLERDIIRTDQGTLVQKYLFPELKDSEVNVDEDNTSG